MALLTDSEIIRSWHLNAALWMRAIEQEEIESRKLITNQAIINVISSFSPAELLDLGCGEGWLAKELVQKGVSVFGIDAVSALIDKAKQIHHAQFDVCTYEDLLKYRFDKKFDCIVCNFSLLGEEATEKAVGSSVTLLKQNGKLIIQTLHPMVACGDFAYEDGWRPGSWAGFSGDFKEPAPWYFRTIEGWCGLLTRNKFQLLNIYEPVHPKTKKPASIIFECGVYRKK